MTYCPSDEVEDMKDVNNNKETNCWEDEEYKQGPMLVDKWRAEVKKEEDGSKRMKMMEEIAQGEGAPVVTINEQKYQISYHYLDNMDPSLEITKQPAVQYNIYF